MVYSFVSDEPTVAITVSHEIISEQLSSVSSTEAEPGGHQFKVVETTVTQWMIMKSTDFYHQETDKLVP
jgi:hypothetical protein